MKEIGKRSRGRQKIRWSDCLSNDLKERKMQRTVRDGGKRSRCRTRIFHVADPNGKAASGIRRSLSQYPEIYTTPTVSQIYDIWLLYSYRLISPVLLIHVIISQGL